MADDGVIDWSPPAQRCERLAYSSRVLFLLLFLFVAFLLFRTSSFRSDWFSFISNPSLPPTTTTPSATHPLRHPLFFISSLLFAPPFACVLERRLIDWSTVFSFSTRPIGSGEKKKEKRKSKKKKKSKTKQNKKPTKSISSVSRHQKKKNKKKERKETSSRCSFLFF